MEVRSEVTNINHGLGHRVSTAEAYDDTTERVNAAYDAVKREDADLANDEGFY
ncbi:MAG: hypothetical protein Q8Q05_00865 [bacterium]|nr:hypothetical protein [bacterium]